MKSQRLRWIPVACLVMAASACGGEAESNQGRDDPPEEPENTTPRISSGVEENVHMSELIEREKLALCLAIFGYAEEQIPSALHCRADGYAAAMAAGGGPAEAETACNEAFTDCEAALPGELATSCDVLPSYDGCHAVWVVDVEVCEADSIDAAREVIETLPTCEEMGDFIADPWVIDELVRPRSCSGMDPSCLLY